VCLRQEGSVAVWFCQAAQRQVCLRGGRTSAAVCRTATDSPVPPSGLRRSKGRSRVEGGGISFPCCSLPAASTNAVHVQCIISRLLQAVAVVQVTKLYEVGRKVKMARGQIDKLTLKYNQ